MSEKKCPACGASIDFNATECKYCGEAIAFQAPQYQVSQTQPVNTYSENTYSENKHLKLYYQEQFHKISESNETYKGKWNWCAFFFSWIWAFTKGLWGLALVSLGISVLFSSLDVSWVSLGISIFWGLCGNYWYYNLEKNKKQFPTSL
jgi:hypothetical protein